MKKNVIIIDDEEEIRETLGRIFKKKLKDMDVEIFVHSSALSALDQIKALPDVALVITDVKMPEMSGLEMIEKLRDEGYRFKIICITGAPDRDEQEVELLLAESNAILEKESNFKATEIIPKPIDVMQLIEQSKEYLK